MTTRYEQYQMALEAKATSALPDRSSVTCFKTGFRDLSEGALGAGLSNRALELFITRLLGACPAAESAGVHDMGVTICELSFLVAVNLA